MIERICSCAAAVAALSITGLTAPTALGAITPLVFGPLDDPGDGSYFTQVYDISADGRSYVGLTNNNVPRYVANGTVYNQTGKTLPVVSIWMIFYLVCSLTISVVVNFFNIRLKIVER